MIWGHRPTFKTSKKEERLVKEDNESYLNYHVTITEWVYNFGSNRFVKTLLFENDRLKEIKTGGYGYDQ
jgi:hypothetical protein